MDEIPLKKKVGRPSKTYKYWIKDKPVDVHTFKKWVSEKKAKAKCEAIIRKLEADIQKIKENIPREAEIKSKQWKKYKPKRKFYNLTQQQKESLNSKCALCGFNSYNVDIHHIDNNRDNNDISNLIGLCPNCHMGIHRGHIKTNLRDIKKFEQS